MTSGSTAMNATGTMYTNTCASPEPCRRRPGLGLALTAEADLEASGGGSSSALTAGSPPGARPADVADGPLQYLREMTAAPRFTSRSASAPARQRARKKVGQSATSRKRRADVDEVLLPVRVGRRTSATAYHRWWHRPRHLLLGRRAPGLPRSTWMSSSGSFRVTCTSVSRGRGVGQAAAEQHLLT
jgi:hypothetical protein